MCIRDRFYVAKRFADGMVGRASMPLSSIDSLVWNGVWGFLIASAAGLLLEMCIRDRLNYEMIDMAAAAEDAIDVVTESLASGDDAAAKSAVEMTRSMDQMERDIENRCLRLLLQHCLLYTSSPRL